MNRFLLTICLWCTSSISLLGQGDFRAIIAHGRAYLNSSDGFHQVLPGQLISDTSRIEMVDNARLILMDIKGRLLTLNESGKIDLGSVDLSQNPDSSRLVYRLWTDFYETLPASNFDSIENVDENGLQLFLPSSSETSRNQVFLLWTDTGAKGYEIQLLDEFEKVFETFQSNQPALILNLLSSKIVWKRQVFIRIVDSTNDQSSGLYALQKLSPPDLDDASAALKTLTKDTDLISVLTLSLFFEKRGWIADVHGLLYLPAIVDEQYREFYFSFLDRNGFSRLKDQVRK